MSDIRQAEIQRKTNETEISVFLNVDGSGISDINTGVPFHLHLEKHLFQFRLSKCRWKWYL